MSDNAWRRSQRREGEWFAVVGQFRLTVAGDFWRVEMWPKTGRTEFEERVPPGGRTRANMPHAKAQLVKLLRETLAEIEG